MRGRACGILLHPTSLPGRFGIGDFGVEARSFADFLFSTGHSYWQILPLGHISYGNSPYMCFSAFGGNPYLISAQELESEGLLTSSDIDEAPEFARERVDYGPVMDFKLKILRKSFDNFRASCRIKYPESFYAFVEGNAFWLEDYALFTALKQAHGGLEWTRWPNDARSREPDGLVEWNKKLAAEVLFWKYVQYQFFKQWASLKDYCNRRRIRIIGDVPIYVAHDSAEVWSHPDLFQLDQQGLPAVVGGVPPDYFSSTGQRWGNPVYRWKVMADNQFLWWTDRLRMNFVISDVLRLDHFRGFQAYWEIPADEQTAVNGRWVEGPGIDFFRTVESALGKKEFIAEDLGVITPDVDHLRQELGYPGMRILQMAFGNDPKAKEYLPYNHIHNCAVYTATHDHNTTVGWFNSKPGTETTQPPGEVESERRYALEYTGGDGSQINWDFIRLALGSVAELAVYPLQDVLGTGAESRMNRPGTVTGNWEWRFQADQLDGRIENRLTELVSVYGRKPARQTGQEER